MNSGALNHVLYTQATIGGLIPFDGQASILPPNRSQFLLNPNFFFWWTIASCVPSGQVISHVYFIIKYSFKEFYVSVFNLRCLKKGQN